MSSSYDALGDNVTQTEGTFSRFWHWLKSFFTPEYRTMTVKEVELQRKLMYVESQLKESKLLVTKLEAEQKILESNILGLGRTVALHEKNLESIKTVAEIQTLLAKRHFPG